MHLWHVLKSIKDYMGRIKSILKPFCMARSIILAKSFSIMLIPLVSTIMIKPVKMMVILSTKIMV